MSPSEAMVQEILARSASAGRDKLGELAYQMARTCLSRAESASDVNIRWFESPRGAAQLKSEFGHLQSRTGLAIESASLPFNNLRSDAGLEAARTCIQTAGTIEGDSTRVQHVRALVAQAEGDIADAERGLVSMLAVPQTRSWTNVIQATLQTVLLSESRYEEVVELGQAILRHSPGDLSCLFNLATACTHMQEPQQFDIWAKQFRQGLESCVGDSLFWSRLIDSETIWFAKSLGREPLDVRSTLSNPTQQRGGG